MRKKSIKGYRKVSSFKVLITILLLAIGLVVGLKLVQQNQENRSNAAFVTESGGGSVPTYVEGRALSFMYNTHMCNDIARGKCADFGKVYSAGTYCKVGTIYGRLRDGFCNGGEFVKCCARNF